MNRNRLGQALYWLIVPIVVVSLAGAGRSDDGEKKAPTAPSAGAKEAASADAGYWLGVLAAPADALLKAHLRIEAGVVVEQVVPDSPAAKAGFQVNDILLKFGEAKLSDVESLQTAVTENKDREAKVTLLRAGKQTTVNVKPEVRPADTGLAVPRHPGDWGEITDWMQKRLEQGSAGEDPLRMFFIQPGVVVPKELKERVELFGTRPDAVRLPKDTRITVTRQGEGPAKVVVERDGQKWEIDENELDKLPADLRPAVKGMLGRGRVFVFGQGSVVVPGDRPASSPEGKTPPTKADKKPAGQQEATGSELGKVRQKLEDMARQLRENDKRLQQQLDDMRQQLEKLGKQKI